MNEFTISIKQREPLLPCSPDTRSAIFECRVDGDFSMLSEMLAVALKDHPELLLVFLSAVKKMPGIQQGNSIDLGGN